MWTHNNTKKIYWEVAQMPVNWVYWKQILWLKHDRIYLFICFLGKQNQNN